MPVVEKKKVLILTYYWPPAGGPGVQRVLKFVKYLSDYGWEPLVLTVERGEYPALDPSLAQEIPSGCKVYQTRTIEFFALFKQLTGRKKSTGIETYILNQKNTSWLERLSAWVRQNLFIPDARKGWVPFAVKTGMEIIRREKPALIFSSSPPHSLQLAAMRLAHRSGLPWVADFRDPWTDAFWDKSLRRAAWAERKNLRLEQQVIQRASAVSTVSLGVAELLQKNTGKHIHVLPNGFDPQNFKFLKKPSARFRIRYTGHIAAAQHPINFFEAITALLPQYGDLLDIRFYGKADAAVIQYLEQTGLKEVVQLLAYIPHEQVIEEITNAEMLLLLIPKEHGKGILTGKLFEYLATHNYILGIGDEAGDAAQILRACQAGEMYDYDREIADVIEAQIQQWSRGAYPQPDTDAINYYDRKRITGELANIFESVCN